jgi:hypothetical protein
MRRVAPTIIFLMIASAIVYIADMQERPIPKTLLPSFRASCVDDDDTDARVHDEVAAYARSLGLSEEAFSRRVGTGITNIEELGCASELSGSSVPTAMQALSDFNVFLAARGFSGSAERLSRWTALCERNACEATAKKLEEELSGVSPLLHSILLHLIAISYLSIAIKHGRACCLNHVPCRYKRLHKLPVKQSVNCITSAGESDLARFTIARLVKVLSVSNQSFQKELEHNDI